MTWEIALLTSKDCTKKAPARTTNTNTKEMIEFSVDHHLPFYSKNNHREFALQQTEFLILQDMKMPHSAHIKNLI